MIKKIGHHAKRLKGAISKRKKPITISASVITAGAAFYFTNVILPLTNPAFINIDSKIEKVAVYAGGVATKSTIDFINPGSRKVKIIAAWYNLSGYNTTRVTFDSSIYSKYLHETVEWLNHADDREMRVSKYFADSVSNVIASGKLLAGDWVLNPGEKYTHEIMINLPKGIYDYYEFQTWVLIAYFEKPKWYILKVENKMDELKDSSKWAVTNYNWLYYQIQPSEEITGNISERAKKLKKLYDNYGMGSSNSVCTLTLWDEYEKERLETPKNP